MRFVWNAFAVFSAALLPISVTQAQPITSAIDGTGTLVSSPNGNQFNITGGTQAGTNLFHSFQQFGLTQAQIANFIAHPGIQNILGRVTGGEASVINGRVQVTGSSANLFLMNPAGIVFGANASLNVPASFTATTANAIAVGNGWFNAMGSNDFATLTGTPNGFAFLSTSGAILNAGDLRVATGQSLSLIGGMVINTGTIAAPGGTITIAVVPGEKLVRISQAGSLLTLELPVATREAIQPPSMAPLSIAELLTGGNLSGATGVTIDNGMVKLTSANTQIPTDAGTAIVAGTLTTASPISVTSAIHVLGDKVGLFGATVNASGSNGGTVLIGGDFQGKGTVPNAQFAVVDAGSTIAADALTTGNGGKVILWSDQATRFLGTISAQGGSQGGDGGFVEVSGKSNLVFKGNVNTSAPLGIPGQLLLDPTNINIGTTAYNGTPGNLAPPVGITAGDVLWAQADDAALSGEITPAQVVSLLINNDLTLEASNNITVSSAINFDGIGFATNRTLTLRAGNDIGINALIDDGNLATTDRLNLVLTGNTDSDPTSGRVFFNAAGGTFTRGGNLTVTNTHSGDFPAIINFTAIDTSGSVAGSGGSITFIGTNTGTGSVFNRGISIQAAITSGGGAITFTGQGNGGINPSGQGIVLFNPVNSGGGNITLTGTSTGTGFSRGISLQAGGSVTSGGGAVSLTGATSGTAPGVSNFNTINSGIGAIVINGTNTSPTPSFSYGAEVGTLASTTGNITVTGSSVANTGVVTGTITSTSGDISLTGDRIDVRAAMVSSGNLLLQPLNPATALTIGSAGAADTTFLNTTEIANLTNGFNSITIGRTDSSGNVDVQAATFNDAVTIRTPSGTGTIALNGTITTNNNEITVVANNAIAVNSAINAGSSTATLNATTINLNAPITATTVTGNTATTVNITNSGAPATSGRIDNGVDLVAVGGTVNAAAGTYTEAITLTKGLTLNGVGVGSTILSGGNSTRVLEVSGTGNVFLNRLTIQDGNVADSGGGILYTGAGALTLTDSAIANNQVTGTFSRGGGIFKDGTGALTLNRTTVSGNTSDTTGGGIYINNGSLIVLDSTIANNTAVQAGGGIRSFSNNAIVNMTNTTLSGNRSGTSGGAFSNAAGTITLSSTTITNNSADVNASGTGNGGGISNVSGSFNLGNSIVAGNFDQSGSGTIHPDVSGTLTDLGYNLIGNGFGSSGLISGSNGNIVGTNANPVNLLLAPLGNYGGTTPTHALLPGSVAINAGTPGLVTPDQRGQPRVGQADIGAVESQGFTITPVSGTVQSTTVTTPFGTPLSVRVTANNAIEPFAGGIIFFVAPTTGASGSFGGSPIITIDSTGLAIAPTFTANATPGTYAVAISLNGTTVTPFSLTNIDTVSVSPPLVVIPLIPQPAIPAAPVAPPLNSIINTERLSRELQGSAVTRQTGESAIAPVEFCIVRHAFPPKLQPDHDLPDCLDFELEDFWELVLP